MLEINKIHNGDCLELMKDIDDKSIDMILCDLPYGTTACKWDTIIPFEPLWEQYKRIIKDNGAIVLFGSEPFSSLLRVSNLKMFRYDWIWDKTRGYNFQQSKYAPMRSHEIISVFSKYPAIFNKKGTCVYYPQKTDLHIEHTSGVPTKTDNLRDGGSTMFKPLKTKHQGFFPKTIQQFKKENKSIHPTQKPVALFEYLIKTYTNENDLVLDNCSGSGTTAIACLGTNRKYICIEKDEVYYKKSLERVEEYNKQLKLF